jgi:hypothetical protein
LISERTFKTKLKEHKTPSGLKLIWKKHKEDDQDDH